MEKPTFIAVKPDDPGTPMPDPIQDLMPELMSQDQPDLKAEIKSVLEAPKSAPDAREDKSAIDTQPEPENAPETPQMPQKRGRGRPKGSKKKKTLAVVPTTTAFKKTTRLYVEAFSQMTKAEIEAYNSRATRLTTAEQVAMQVVLGAVSGDQKSVDRFIKLTDERQQLPPPPTPSSAPSSSFFDDAIEGVAVEIDGGH